MFTETFWDATNSQDADIPEYNNSTCTCTGYMQNKDLYTMWISNIVTAKSIDGVIALAVAFGY